MKALIDSIKHISADDSITIQKGITNADISEPIILDDILFRKTQRCVSESTEPSELPFEINSYTQSIDCYAYKQTYIRLGLLLFEFLFSDKPYLELHIPHEKSNIRQFFVYLNRTNTHNPFLKVEQLESYSAYDYWSQEIEKFPFTNLESKYLPCFYLGCSDQQFQFSEQRVAKSDQLIMVVSAESLINCAELFLSIGNEQNTQTEICLENPLYGFGGVQEKSMDIRFWLPNSFGFYTDDINDLDFG